MNLKNLKNEVNNFKTAAKTGKFGDEPVTASELNAAVDAAAALFAAIIEKMEND